MEEISSTLVIARNNEIESFTFEIMFTHEFSIRFFSDVKTRTAFLMNRNWRNQHSEFVINTKDFNVLLKNFQKTYESLERLDEVITFPNNIGESENLIFKKADNKIYMKGCLMESCPGIYLPNYTVRGWNQFKDLMRAAFDIKLNFR